MNDNYYERNNYEQTRQAEWEEEMNKKEAQFTQRLYEDKYTGSARDYNVDSGFIEALGQEMARRS